MTGRILILRALGLGDFLTGVPAYRALRRAFPRHRIVLAAPGPLSALCPLTGAVDRLLPTGELRPVGWTGPPPQIAIDLHGNGPASHRLLAALRPERLIVFGGPQAGGFTGPRWRPREHEVARWCRLCQESGIPADPADLLLAGPLRGAGPAPRQAAPSGATVVHPGAAASSRRWPAGRFAEVARHLSGSGQAIVITGSPAERPLARRVARLAGLPASVVWAGRTPLGALAALIASARLVISGDTGVAHLATAYARPSVTLFGPVPPAEWGPPQHPCHQVLWAAAPGYRGDPHAEQADPALAAIPAGAVLAAAGRALRAADAAGAVAQRARTVPGLAHGAPVVGWPGFLDGGAITGDVLAMEAGTRVSRARPVAGQA
jgi:ADP-heptose:LPS heptosyltransferase